jgi:hypothetical protein
MGMSAYDNDPRVRETVAGGQFRVMALTSTS